jgi:hypothetical protein
LKQVAKVLVLFLLLGVPVCWYLFLQLFGENKFELPTITTIEASCNLTPNTLYRLPRELTIGQNNELRRLEDKLDGNVELQDYSGSGDCFEEFGEADLILLGMNNEVKGIYQLTIEEVDRAIVECDLLIHLMSEE